MTYTNSSLVTYKRLTNNRTSPRNHEIDTITIHCIAGQWTAKQGCDYFATTDQECSANYVVGRDGSIGLSVEEKNRSWCSSSRSNDHRAITIEVASDAQPPYAVTKEAYEALIKLLADICKRNGIKKLLWKADKSLIGQVTKQNMTVHRWFANKACPGEYLYSRHGDIAAKVNAVLGNDDAKPASKCPYVVRVTASKLKIRKHPSTTSVATGTIRDKGLYTIVEEANGAGASKWGKLKSGAGWISLDYTERV